MESRDIRRRAARALQHPSSRRPLLGGRKCLRGKGNDGGGGGGASHEVVGGHMVRLVSVAGIARWNVRNCFREASGRELPLEPVSGIRTGLLFRKGRRVVVGYGISRPSIGS